MAFSRSPLLLSLVVFLALGLAWCAILVEASVSSASAAVTSNAFSQTVTATASGRKPQQQTSPWFQIRNIRGRNNNCSGNGGLWKAQCKRQRGKRSNLFFSQPQRQGTFLSLGREPTLDRVSRWFWGTSPIQFNHAFVGMTHPCLHIAVNNNEFSGDCCDDGPTSSIAVGLSDVAGDASDDDFQQQRVSLVSSRQILRQTDASAEASWWPQGPYKSILASAKKESSWRMVRVCKRVGYGRQCYERVKEAALAVDFEAPAGGKGIVSVLPPSNLHNNNRTPDAAACFHRFALQQSHNAPAASMPVDSTLSDVHSASHHHQQGAIPIWPGGGRRLATYTRCLGRIFAVNPVSIVYEMVDQRAPAAAASCLYTSTAFATLQGHWMCGEERVTVALRGSGSDDLQADAPVDVEILSLSKPAPSLFGRIAWPLSGRMQRTFFHQQMNALEQAAAARQ